jgi:flagellar biosynthesis chaperone FliJ
MSSNKKLLILGLFMIFALASGTLFHLSLATAQGASDYKGPDYCGACHSENYEKWTDTMHAQAFSDPIFQQVWTARGSPSECLACHTTGYNEETGEYALEGVTCERCHGGPGAMQKTIDASLCGECHTDTHHPTYDEWQASKHSESIEALKAIGQDKNEYCLGCHSAEGAMGKIENEEWSVEEATTPIVCVVCHDPHELELRVEPSSSLCGQCHTGQYELWSSDSPHGIVDVQCANCHMYTKPYVSEEEPAITGHTFEIVEEDDKPLVCQNCHGVIEGIPDYDTAVTVLKNIQASVGSMKEEIKSAISSAEEVINDAKATSGVDASVIEEATNLLNEAKHVFEIEVERAYSNGFHNPMGVQKLIGSILGNVSEAKSMALAAKADALSSQLTANQDLVKTLQEQNKELQNQLKTTKDQLKATQDQLAASQDEIKTLQSKVSSLNEQVSTLKKKVSELEGATGMTYPYLIIGLVIGLVIGGIAAYAVRRKS